MRVEHRDQALARLEADPAFTNGLPPGLVRAFRKRMNFLRQAADERDIYAWASLRFEKLKGQRAHQRSIRLNDQWRLILEFEGAAPNKAVVIVAIEDYH